MDIRPARYSALTCSPRLRRVSICSTAFQGNTEIIPASQFLHLGHLLTHLRFVHFIKIIPERSWNVLAYLAVVPCTRLPGQITQHEKPVAGIGALAAKLPFE